MRKFVVLLLLMMVMFVPLIPASAQTDLTRILANVPDSTLAVVAGRVDAAYLDTLDGLLAPFLALGGMPAGMEIRDALDSAVAGSGISFSEDILPWVGDYLALGLGFPSRYYENPNWFYVRSPESLISELEAEIMIVELADSAAALAFFQNFTSEVGAGLPEPETVGAFTVYDLSEQMRGPVLGFSDTLLVAYDGMKPELGVVFTGDFTPITASDNFTTMTGLLPESAYNIMAYMNAPAYRAVLEEVGPESSYPEDYESAIMMLDTLGSLSVGLTVLGGPTLTVDIARSAPSSDAVMALTLPSVGAVNPAFAANIPVYMPFVVHSTNLAGLLTGADAMAAGVMGVAPSSRWPTQRSPG